MTDQTPQARSSRSTLIGTVVSTKMDKTITVQVETMSRHPKYGKYVRQRRRYHVHAPDAKPQSGDVVEIASTRPMSKLKRFRLLRVVTKAVERGAEVSEISKI